ncbi:MAG: hypothetical protein JRD68_01270 [Deltaproteobacteria bacterium]|nr:hypothetical protein [Deltaproteobacteria bacterium]
MISQIIGTIGLSCDIFGALLVAIEVFRIYRGELTGTIEKTWQDLGKPTFPFLKFEKQNRRVMATGVGFLVVGFLLQIVALWV